MRKATIRSVVKTFHTIKPRTPQDTLQECGVSLRYLSSGCFRDVYRVDDLPVVVKYPRGDDAADNIQHAGDEWHGMRRIVANRKRFTLLVDYMPHLYYFDAATGVTLMHEYKPLPPRHHLWSEIQKIDDCVSTTLHRSWDNHVANLGLDDKGHLVIVDLGCLGFTEW